MSAKPVIFEALESRQLLSVATPSVDEQLLVELINRARANPTAEAQLQGIDLNEGLAPGTITATPKQPLAINPYLTDAAREHSQHMLDVDQFAHDGIGDGTPSSRAADAGYVVVAPGGVGENIAWTGNTGIYPDPTSTTSDLHDALFIDAGIDGRGHRINILYDNYKEVGAGIESGIFTQGSYNYKSVMLDSDFAYSAGDSFLTGVAYTDTIVQDRFYTPGEGLGSVVITATDLTTHAVFTTQTWDSGGYTLQLPDGRYRVTAQGNGIDSVLRVVTINGLNVKRDFTPGSADVAIYRNGQFFFDTNGNHQLDIGDRVFNFGLPTDIPIVGDWNGDGTMKAGLYRDGLFILDVNGSGTWDAGDVAFAYGVAGDTPIVGDWNGDGIDDVGIRHGATFALDSNGSRSWSLSDSVFVFGLEGDTPIAGDWTGDGYAKIGIVRDAVFALDMNGNHQWDMGDRQITFGFADDTPIVGDWNRDGIAKIGIRRGNIFALDKNNSGIWDNGDEAFSFGIATDKPLAFL